MTDPTGSPRRAAGKAQLQLVVAFGFLMLVPLAGTPADAERTAEEEQLIERLKQEIMQELPESDFLQKEIAAGIRNYVKKQQETRNAARTNKARKSASAAKNSSRPRFW